MTNKEIEVVRCLIGNIAKIPPDNIIIVKEIEEVSLVFYLLDNYMGKNLVLGYDEVPTLHNIREDIKDLYLMIVEWDWDEENPI